MTRTAIQSVSVKLLQKTQHPPPAPLLPRTLGVLPPFSITKYNHSSSRRATRPARLRNHAGLLLPPSPLKMTWNSEGFQIHSACPWRQEHPLLGRNRAVVELKDLSFVLWPHYHQMSYEHGNNLPCTPVLHRRGTDRLHAWSFKHETTLKATVESGKHSSKMALNQRPGHSRKHGCVCATCVGNGDTNQPISRRSGIYLELHLALQEGNAGCLPQITDVCLAESSTFKKRHSLREVWSQISPLHGAGAAEPSVGSLSPARAELCCGSTAQDPQPPATAAAAGISQRCFTPSLDTGEGAGLLPICMELVGKQGRGWEQRAPRC